MAVGHVTPGPVFTTATFIGYLLGGPAGALVATVGIFLPSFVFVAASGPLIPRIRKAPLAATFLDGVNVAALALMAGVTWQIARAALVDWAMVGCALLSTLLLLRFKVNSAWLIVGAAAIGGLAAVRGRHHKGSRHAESPRREVCRRDGDAAVSARNLSDTPARRSFSREQSRKSFVYRVSW